MREKINDRYIRSDEALQELIRPSWLLYWRRLTIAIAVLALAVFFLYPAFRFGHASVWIVAGVCGCAMLYLARLIVLRQLNFVLLTNRRVIDVDQSGLFAKQVTEVALENIQDIRYTTSGLLPSLFQVGTIVLQTVSGRIDIGFVKQPHWLQDRIMQVQRSVVQRSKARATEQEDEI